MSWPSRFALLDAQPVAVAPPYRGKPDENGGVEKKLDSGNYDMQTSRQSSLRMQRELEAVKEAMRRENSGVGSHTKRPPASADSGRQSGESPPSPARQERKQSGFINFSAAKERNKVQIAAAAATSRGSELLQMIRLDIVISTCGSFARLKGMNRLL